MNKGHFYYITDQYFTDFPDPYLMKNKEAFNGNVLAIEEKLLKKNW